MLCAFCCPHSVSGLFSPEATEYMLSGAARSKKVVVSGVWTSSPVLDNRTTTYVDNYLERLQVAADAGGMGDEPMMIFELDLDFATKYCKPMTTGLA